MDATALSKSELVLGIWKYRPWFIGCIARMAPRIGSAEDVFQEACARFLASNAVFIHPAAATSYFCRILKSLVADEAKRAWRLQCRENLPEMTHDPWPAHARQQLVERVCETSRRLSRGDQRILDVYLNGNSEMSRGLKRYRTAQVVRKLRAMNAERA